jgi:vitamin B12 transporter
MINFRDKKFTSNFAWGFPVHNATSMKKYRQLCLTACLCTAWPGFSQEQSDSIPTQELQGVVVSDTRFPLKREQSGKTVIRLGPEELAAYRGQTLATVLNQQSGFEISGSRGRPGEVLGVFARGGRGRQVLVLLDGLRVSDPSSASREYDLRLLPVANIASVEILKGASSVLYGANAATAVINIKTKAPEQKPLSLSVQGSMGTHNTPSDSRLDLGRFSHFVNLGGQQGNWDYKAAFSHDYANGLSSLSTGLEEDPYSNWSLDLNVGHQMSEKSRLGFFANKTQMKTDFDDSFSGKDALFEYRTEQKRAGLQWEWRDSLQQIQLIGAYTGYDSESISDFPGRFEGHSLTADLTYKRELLQGLQGLAGLNFIRDRAVLATPVDFTLADPYLNLVWTDPSGFNLNTGLRLNIHSTYGTKGVYQVNPSYAYRFGKGYLKLMGTLATSYITPSLSQLYGAFGANPDLNPETNRTLEAGTELGLDSGLRFSLVYFDRLEENTVQFNNAEFVYFNAPEAIGVRGVEAEMRWNWHPYSQISLNYTYTEREGGNAIRIPKHKLNLSAWARLGQRTRATARYSFTGKRTDTDFSTFTPVELGGFSLIDLRLDHTFVPGRLSAFLSIDNVLNTSYTEVLGFATPGRNYLLGWSLKL